MLLRKEATARIKINRLLEAAGWRFFDDKSLAFVGSFHAFMVRLDLPGSPLVEVQVVTGSEVNFRAGDTVDLVPDPQAVSFFAKEETSAA